MLTHICRLSITSLRRNVRKEVPDLYLSESKGYYDRKDRISTPLTPCLCGSLNRFQSSDHVLSWFSERILVKEGCYTHCVKTFLVNTGDTTGQRCCQGASGTKDVRWDTPLEGVVGARRYTDCLCRLHDPPLKVLSHYFY